jgi:pSer/pThr/pTyr-binding forkhead associated (FHA) protein
MRTVTFQVLEGVDKGRVFRALPIPVTIGREEGNLLRLNDERVSRYHAKIQLDNEDIVLTDLESTNGTRVNGNPVSIRRLRPGDQVGLGRSTLLFGTQEEIAARNAALASAGQAAPRTVIPQGKTVFGEGPDLDLELRPDLALPTVGAEQAWPPANAELPPLPLRMTPAQAARLSEILDFLHRGLTLATENLRANEDGTQVRLNFTEWQKIQAVQWYLARYLRAVAEPDAIVDG